MKAIRPPPSPALRKHTSVHAAFPSSLGVIYWTGAGCHCWVIAAETVTHSVKHSGMWEACGIHTGILFHCCNTLTVQSSTLSASGCIINAHEGAAGNQCHSGSKTEIFCICRMNVFIWIFKGIVHGIISYLLALFEWEQTTDQREKIQVNTKPRFH